MLSRRKSLQLDRTNRLLLRVRIGYLDWAILYGTLQARRSEPGFGFGSERHPKDRSWRMVWCFIGQTPIDIVRWRELAPEQRPFGILRALLGRRRSRRRPTLYPATLAELDDRTLRYTSSFFEYEE
jgi:hypothetical protein